MPSESPCPHKEISREGLWDLASVCVFLFLFLSLSLPDLFSSWKLSWGWKEWRLGWPGGLGREAGENTFQILIKSLFVVCSLQPLSLSLSLGFPLSLSLPASHSLPVSLLLPSQSPCLFPWISLSPSLLSVSLSPDPSMFLTPLSASTSVCPSLPVLVHLSVSLCLPVRGCLCPSASPPICLVVCASPLEGTRSLTKAPSPRSAKASPGSEGGEGGCRAAASGSFGSSWAEPGVRGQPAAEAVPPLGSQAKDPGAKRESRASLQLSLCVCKEEAGGLTLPSFHHLPPKARPWRRGSFYARLPHPLAHARDAGGSRREGLGDARPWVKKGLEPQLPVSWVGGGLLPASLPFPAVPGDPSSSGPTSRHHTRGCTCSSHRLHRGRSHLHAALEPQTHRDMAGRVGGGGWVEIT